MEMFYDFEVVGGRFDATTIERAWCDDGKTPCPDRILVGVCEQGRCGSDRCRRGHMTHISYWTPNEKLAAPKDVTVYSKEREYVKRDDDATLHGRAVYALGGLMDPRNFGADAREPVEDGVMEPLTHAAAAGGWPHTSNDFAREVWTPGAQGMGRAQRCRCVLIPVGR